MHTVYSRTEGDDRCNSVCNLVCSVHESFLVIPIDAIILLVVYWLFVVPLSETSTLALRPTQPVRALRQGVAGLSRRRPSFGPRPHHVKFVVDKLALGQVSLPVLRFSPAIIFPPMLHTHLHPNTATIRRTSGQNVGTVQKCSAQRSTADPRKSVPRGGSTFHLFDFRVKFPHKK
jgi:hypothetical protein